MYLRKPIETEFKVYTVGMIKFVIFHVNGVFVEVLVTTAGNHLRDEMASSYHNLKGQKLRMKS
jgi:hypothetical protein